MTLFLPSCFPYSYSTPCLSWNLTSMEEKRTGLRWASWIRVSLQRTGAHRLSHLCERLSPFEQAGDGGAEGGFEDGGLAVREGDDDFAEGFVRGVLAGNVEEPGGAVGIGAGAQIEGAGGFFRLVEELGLGHAALEGGEDVAEIGEAPFHGDFVFPIELALAGLGGGIEEDGGFGAVEAEADNTAIAAGIRLVDGVIGGTGGGGRGFEGGFVHGVVGLVGLAGRQGKHGRASIKCSYEHFG